LLAYILVPNSLERGVKKMADIKIKAETKEVGDPAIPIFKITVESGNGIWEETYGSRELVDAFLKGLQAAFSFTEVGYIAMPTCFEHR
jgi:hypothetical protein